jgi:sulfite reductase beta subunit-like hemoprotein
VRGITEIFREQQGLRESRDRARMKYLFLREGWTAERFLTELQSKLDFQLARRPRPVRTMFSAITRASARRSSPGSIPSARRCSMAA